MKTNAVRVVALALMTVIVFAGLWYTNSQHIEITVEGAYDKLEVELGSEFVVPNATAHYTSLFNPNGEAVEVTVSGTVDTTKLGAYTLEYVAKNNGETTKKIITVEVKDTTPPVITLVKGDNPYTSPVASYEEEGYTATDNCDGDITANVIRTETHDKVTYTVKDSSGNETTVEREIVYKDVIAPKITLLGNSSVVIKVGDTYNESGFSATDEVDGNVTAKVAVTGSVDTTKTGVNYVNYTVTDSSGNTAKATRTVYVISAQTDYQIQNPGNKVIYLTFDDGPCVYTQKLLNVLAKYNVKATFFVTGVNGNAAKYRYLIGEEARQGHTVAVHTYTHQWNVYDSVDAFHSDVEKMNDIIEEQTGKRATILRFPGGSSNTVSKSHCSGIMSQLVVEVGNWGYRYFDWNVSSGDAGGTTSTEQVYRNVINGCKKHNVSVVLQHDIKSYSVNAVEKIIQWGLANGYTFLPLSESSPDCHAEVRN